MSFSTIDNIDAFVIKLQRNGTDIYIGDADGSRSRTTISGYVASKQTISPFVGGFSFLDAPSSTSSVTYKVVVRDNNADNCSFFLNRGSDNTDQVNNARGASSIQVMEIASSILT